MSIYLLSLSIDVTEVEGSKWTDDEEDENYEPSFNITLRCIISALTYHLNLTKTATSMVRFFNQFIIDK